MDIKKTHEREEEYPITKDDLLFTYHKCHQQVFEARAEACRTKR